MKHDEEYLQTFRHDMPNEPCFTGVEVQAECRAYHEHMVRQETRPSAERPGLRGNVGQFTGHSVTPTITYKT